MITQPSKFAADRSRSLFPDKLIDKKLQGRVLEAISEIVKEPIKQIGNKVKLLTDDKKGLWRYRIGKYRLVYRPEVDTNRIFLLTCAARGSVY